MFGFQRPKDTARRAAVPAFNFCPPLTEALGRLLRAIACDVAHVKTLPCILHPYWIHQMCWHRLRRRAGGCGGARSTGAQRGTSRHMACGGACAEGAAADV